MGPWSQLISGCGAGRSGRSPEHFRLAATRWDRGPSLISGAVPGGRTGHRSISVSQARGGTVVPIQFQVQCREPGPVTGAVPSRRHEVGPWSQFNFVCGAVSMGRITGAVLPHRQEVGPWSQFISGCGAVSMDRITGAVPPSRHEVGPWSQLYPWCGAGSPGQVKE